VWGIILVSQIDSRPSPTIAHLLAWLISLPLELLILGATLSIYTVRHREPVIGDADGGKLQETITRWEVFEVLVISTRIALFLILASLFLAVSLSRRNGTKRQPDAQEDREDERPLLANHANGHPNT
jgi:ATP-binding cassette, subfamily B, vacuolar membrane transporter HMT1/ACLQ